jgi:hypothetical protein
MAVLKVSIQSSKEISVRFFRRETDDDSDHGVTLIYLTHAGGSGHGHGHDI